ncbi:MAG: restriction endonuclease [Henriciella sp.]|uniref:restriction endonuclease n=1 Tax=Henriciella sp. TaxID=1968823 RepID=UPI003C76FFE2
MSRLWLIRLGKYGEAEARALEDGTFATGWEIDQDVTDAKSREELLKILEQTYPNKKAGTLKNWAVQINQLFNTAQEGDLVVIPFKTTGEVGIGRIKGGPLHVDGKFPGRRVQWLATDLPREAIKQDLRFSMGASQTVCEIHRNNAAARFETIARTRQDPGPIATSAKRPVATDETVEDTDLMAPDIGSIARQQVEDHISANFAGHEFTALIAAILEAQGYRTEVTPPGPDRGIDIVAGKGELGFDAPRLVVQVKSGDLQGDQPTLQSLIGSVQDAHAEHGLLVCWSGFKQTVRQRLNELYFRIRLWGRKEILDELFDVYDDLPEDLKAKLRLQRVWTVVPDEDVEA